VVGWDRHLLLGYIQQLTTKIDPDTQIWVAGPACRLVCPTENFILKKDLAELLDLISPH